MKGLLVKDLRITFRRKQQLLMLLAICVMIAFCTEGSFVIGYSAILIGIPACVTVLPIGEVVVF